MTKEQEDREGNKLILEMMIKTLAFSNTITQEVCSLLINQLDKIK